MTVHPHWQAVWGHIWKRTVEKRQTQPMWLWILRGKRNNLTGVKFIKWNTSLIWSNSKPQRSSSSQKGRCSQWNSTWTIILKKIMKTSKMRENAAGNHELMKWLTNVQSAMKKMTIKALKQMCTLSRDGRRRRRHLPLHVIKNLINFQWISL